MTTLGDHIAVIIGDGTEKQMLWVDTDSIITMMKNTKARRNRFHKESIGHTMGTVDMLVSYVTIQCSISRTMYRAIPGPAIIWFFFCNFGPEMFFRSGRAGSMLTGYAAIFPVPGLGGDNVKDIRTMLTHESQLGRTWPKTGMAVNKSKMLSLYPPTMTEALTGNVSRIAATTLTDAKRYGTMFLH